MAIHTTTTISFGLDHKLTATMMNSRILARGWMYPKGDFFCLAFDGQNESHLSFEEWEEVKNAIQEMIDRANTIEIK